MNNENSVIKRTFGYFDENYDGICLKYIPVLNSDILLHPYYKFPPVDYPEILESPVELSDEEFYISICSKLNVNTINLFINQLPTDEINLKYYGLNSKHMETICRTLIRNNNIKKLNLSYNFLTEESCVSLADLLASNQTIQCLDLTNCRIQCGGAKQLAEGLKSNITLKELFLSFNNVKDDGLDAILSPEILAPIEKCILKRNDLYLPLQLISYVSKSYLNLKEIDLSWNSIDVTNGIRPFLRNLKTNKSVEVLNLSWNAIENVAIALKFFFRVNETLRYLDLSYNRLRDYDVSIISWCFRILKSLETIKIGNNPVSTNGATMVINNFRYKADVLKILDMENICVTLEFVNIAKKVMDENDDVKVIYGDIIGNYTIIGPNFRELLFRRARYLSQKGKKKIKKDFAKFAIKLYENFATPPDSRELVKYITKKRIVRDKVLIEEIVDAFPSRKKKHADVIGMSTFAKTMWPEVVEQLAEMERAKAARALLKKPKKKKANRKPKKPKLLK